MLIHKRPKRKQRPKKRPISPRTPVVTVKSFDKPKARKMAKLASGVSDSGDWKTRSSVVSLINTSTVHRTGNQQSSEEGRALDQRNKGCDIASMDVHKTKERVNNEIKKLRRMRNHPFLENLSDSKPTNPNIEEEEDDSASPGSEEIRLDSKKNRLLHHLFGAKRESEDNLKKEMENSDTGLGSHSSFESDYVGSRSGTEGIKVIINPLRAASTGDLRLKGQKKKGLSFEEEKITGKAASDGGKVTRSSAIEDNSGPPKSILRKSDGGTTLTYTQNPIFGNNMDRYRRERERDREKERQEEDETDETTDSISTVSMEIEESSEMSTKSEDEDKSDSDDSDEESSSDDRYFKILPYRIFCKV